MSGDTLLPKKMHQKKVMKNTILGDILVPYSMYTIGMNIVTRLWEINEEDNLDLPHWTLRLLQVSS